MHPSILIPQSPCMANAVSVAIAMAPAPAAGVCVAGVSYREAGGRKRGPAIAGVHAGSAGIPSAGTRPAPNENLPIILSHGRPSPTPEESRVNT